MILPTISHQRRFQSASLVLLVLLTLSSTASAGKSKDDCCCSPPELWVVYTRHMPRCCNLDCAFPKMRFKRYDQCRGCFVRSSMEEFLAREATMPTMFYVHGNTLSHEGAMRGFWDVYEALRCCPGRKRLVCWSWPAQRVYKTEGLRFREMIDKNLRIKYVYSEYQGYYLAKLVEQMSLSQRVTLSGHSYGVVTASVALHLIGGGQIRGLRLASGAPYQRPNLRGVMISGALDYDVLYPGHRYGQAFVAAEKIMVTHNCRDRTLRRWPRTSDYNRQAMGKVGINSSRLGPYRHKLVQVNCHPENRTSHYLRPHLNNPRFMSALCCVAFKGATYRPPVQSELPTLQATESPEEEPLEQSQPDLPGAAIGNDTANFEEAESEVTSPALQSAGN